MNAYSFDRNPHTSRTRINLTVLVMVWLALGFAMFCPSSARAQSWVSVPTANTNVFSGLPILLTDGTVIVQDAGTFSGWWKLTPDPFGSYANGAWSQIASMPVINGTQYAPLYYGSAVLADGRLVVFGGEYNNGNNVETNLGAIYDSVADTWTAVDGPGWTNIGDASSCVLPNGKFLLGDPFGADAAILDPSTLTWTTASTTGKADINSEEGWTLLPDGNILTVDTENGTNSEIYNPTTGEWSSAGSTVVQLTAGPINFVPEMGPQVLRPDGTVACFGASGHNALFHSSTTTWSSMPDFPSGLDCADGPACLLPSGNVFVIASPGFNNPGAAFFEYDGTDLNREPNLINLDSEVSSYFSNMLMLPTGQVLFADTANEVELYNSVGSPHPAWVPTISSCPTSVVPGQTYTIFGTQFNGLSQCSMFGDDSQNATNYPLVRITNLASGHVIYFRTHDHSTMAVATGTATVSTNFDVPSNAELGAANLVVVTNGIPSAPVSITVSKTPTANPQTDDIAHNTATGLTLTGSDPDNPPLPLTFAIATQPSNGTLSGLNASTGAVTYTPNANFQGTDSFTFTVNNGFVTSSPAMVTLIVAPGKPTANPQTVAVALGTPTAIKLTGVDPDIPVLPLTFAIATSPLSGVLSGLNTSTGAVTYTPNSGFHGTDSFTFTVNNGTNTSAAAKVTLNVAPGTPTANPQTVAVAHNTDVTITLTGSDPDNPPLKLKFALASAPTHGILGAVNAATGAVIYEPNRNFQGTDSFTFTVSNGINTSAPATVTINVAPGTPTANAQTDPITHNTARVIKLTGSDPDNPALPLTFAIASQPADGTLSGLNTSTGSVTYTPNNNFHGKDSFTFTVSNGTNKSAAAAVTLNVATGTPTGNAQTVAVSHNTAVAITLTGTDSDNPALPLTFAIASQPLHGTLSGPNTSTGAVTYTPSNNFGGTDSFTFTVSNGTNTSAAAKVTLNVAPGTPTANPQTVAVAHNTDATITLIGSDPDNPPLKLKFALASAPTHGILGTVNAATGAVIYEPNRGFQGTDSFTFTVSNGTNTSAPATVTLNVAPGTPTANAQTDPVTHNTARAIKLTGSDPDNPALPLTFAIASQPADGTLTGLNTSTGAVTYTPGNNFHGKDSFTFTVSNGTNTSAPATVTLNVAIGTPTANAQTVAVSHNTAAVITLTGTDPDNPALTLTFAIASQPAHGTLSGLNSSTGAVTYTPSNNFQGADSFTFTLSNGTNTSAAAKVTLNVAPGTPTANSQTVAVAHNTDKTITLTGADPDNPALKLKFALASAPTHGILGAVNAATGAVIYEPNRSFQGTDSFTFTVSNGINTSAPATVTLNVAAGTPIANAQTVAIAHNTAKVITLTGIDPDNPALPLTFAIATGPTHGVLSALNTATGVVTYTPNANYSGTDSFTFTVSNGTNKSAPATVTLTISAGG